MFNLCRSAFPSLWRKLRWRRAKPVCLWTGRKTNSRRPTFRSLRRIRDSFCYISGGATASWCRAPDLGQRVRGGEVRVGEQVPDTMGLTSGLCCFMNTSWSTYYGGYLFCHKSGSLRCQISWRAADKNKQKQKHMALWDETQRMNEIQGVRVWPDWFVLLIGLYTTNFIYFLLHHSESIGGEL